MLLALINLQPQIKKKRVRVLCDNLGAVTCFHRNASSVRRVNAILRTIYVVAQINDCDLWLRWQRRCVYGIRLADAISKSADFSDWSLDKRALAAVLSYGGLPWPTIDGFASMANAVADTCFTRQFEGSSAKVNVLSRYSFREFEWDKHRAYFNPPFHDRTIEQTLELVRARGIAAYVILPMWRRRTWWNRAVRDAQLMVYFPRQVVTFNQPPELRAKPVYPKWDTVCSFYNCPELRKNEKKFWKLE